MAERRTTVQWGAHERQRLALYDRLLAPSAHFAQPALVFVHGGAWQDPKNTEKDADGLHAELNAAVALGSVDYRIDVQHPVFADDVEAGVRRCMAELGVESVSLLGHSVGAMLALQTLGRGVKVDKLYLVDGIYNLTELVDEYPDYRGFVERAHADYKDVSFDFSLLKDTTIHVLHSYDDELLSLRQTHWFVAQLEEHRIAYTLYVGSMGAHNDVYARPSILADYINRTLV